MHRRRDLHLCLIALTALGSLACEAPALMPAGAPTDAAAGEPPDGATPDPPDIAPPAPDAGPPDAPDAASPDGAFDPAPDAASPDAASPDAEPEGEPGLCRYPVHPLPSVGGAVQLRDAAYDLELPPHACRDGQTPYGRVVHLELERAATVGVHAPGGFYAFARAACEGAETACADQLPAVFDLEAGAHFITVTGNPRSIELELDPPAPPFACRNGVDDDLDGRIDLDDPGCVGPGDPLETDIGPAPACADGVDNDQDGLVDWPDDPACAAAGGDTEAACGPPGTVTLRADEPYLMDPPIEEPLGGFECLHHPARHVFRYRVETATRMRINRPSAIYRGCAIEPAAQVACGVGQVLLPPGEYLIAIDGDPDEPPPVIWADAFAPGPCADGRDNDGDGQIDLADSGCVSPIDGDEGSPVAPPACANGIDDDADGAIDWPADPDCAGAGAASEAADCVGPLATLSADGGALQHHAVAVEDASGACDDHPTPGALFAVDLDRPARLRVERRRALDRDPPLALRVRQRCDDRDSELACPEPGEATPLLDAGRWYVSIGRSPDERIRGTDEYVVTALVVTACDNSVDDDADGAIDADDPGCRDRLDDDERDPVERRACSNGVDDDGDGRVDFPDDPDCLGGGDPTEVSLCGDLPVYEPSLGELVLDPDYVEQARSRCGLEGPVQATAVRVDVPANTFVGLTGPPGVTRCVFTDCDQWPIRGDRLDLGPHIVVFEHPLGEPRPHGEHGLRVRAETVCRNGEDDDADGLIDHEDPGCASRDDTDEADPLDEPACANGIDDDGDGAIDYPDDPDCATAGDSEQGPCAPHRAAAAPIEAPGGRRVIDMRHSGGPALNNACTAPPGAWVLNVDARAFVEVRVDRPSRLVARTAHSGFDPALALVSACTVDADPSRCDADSGPGVEARLEVARVEPGTHTLLVTAPFLQPRLPFDAGLTEPWTTTLVVDLEPLAGD